MKMLIFDIDGTLLLTGGAGKIAFERAFAELFRIPDSWKDTRPDGKTDPAIFQEIAQRTLGRELTAAEYLDLMKRYLELFREEILNADRFRLMPGVYELLESLSFRSDTLLGIATGNVEEAAWSKLERGALRRFFRFGGFGSDSADRAVLTRRAVERGQALLGRQLAANDIFLIGDTEKDIQAGKALGLRTVAVATGRLDRAGFRPYAPDILLEDLSDAGAFVEALGI